MATNGQIVQRWVREVRKTDGTARYLSDNSNTVHVYHYGGEARIYSWGSHFEMARWVKPVTTGRRADRHAGFWLLNGDRVSVSTDRHQSEVRSAVEATGAPVLILPFTPLNRAGIDLATIVPVEITADRWEPKIVTRDEAVRRFSTPGSLDYYIGDGDVIDLHNGTYKIIRGTHRLGESVFHASYETRERKPRDVYPMDVWNNYEYVTVRASAYFLSGFDAQERTRHYFLAQLPAKAKPVSVKDAFEILRPAVVKNADIWGHPVTRQGDIFAVPTEFTTRNLTKAGGTIVKAGHLLGQRHTATAVIEVPSGKTYARGTLTHTGGEHRRQRMGDGKTWHLIVKNTVPVDASGQNRAWSQVGSVD